MIRSICLNPVIDKVYFIDHFTAGRLYRDNCPARYAGGKGVNVAKVLALLGEACAIYGFIGGDSGRRLEDEIISLGIQSKFIGIAGDTRTTINVIDKERNLETEILELGPAVAEEELQALIGQLTADIAPGDIVICSGAIINGAPPSIYKAIAAICVAKAAYCFLDTCGEAFHASLPGQYYFAKPNLKEFSEYLGLENKVDDRTIVAQAERLMAKGFENLMVSMGKSGALLVNHTVRLQASPPVISNQSSIGSGDASVAGYAAAINRGSDVEEAFCLSMACGVSNAMHREVGFIDLSEVNELKKRIELRHL
jgi:1-phosphofructokinase family hexose kinase